MRTVSLAAMGRQIPKGLWLPLDLARIPHWDNVDPKLLEIKWATLLVLVTARTGLPIAGLCCGLP